MNKSLKEEFLKLLEKDKEFRYAVAGYLGFSEILKRLDGIEEEIKKLWESQNRLWEEIRSLREDQGKLWEEIKALREGQNRLWEEVRALRKGQEVIWKYIKTGFRGLSRALGMPFEDYARAFVELMLSEMGYPEATVSRRIFVYNGEILEINVFCEKPLVVGETTMTVSSIDDARKEVEKVIERVKFIEKKYGKKPFLTILAVAHVPEDIAKTLKKLTEEHGIKLVLGREIKKYF